MTARGRRFETKERGTTGQTRFGPAVGPDKSLVFIDAGALKAWTNTNLVLGTINLDVKPDLRKSTPNDCRRGLETEGKVRVVLAGAVPAFSVLLRRKV